MSESNNIEGFKSECIDEIATLLATCDSFQNDCEAKGLTFDDFSLYNNDLGICLKEVDAPEGEQHSIIVMNDNIYTSYDLSGDKQREERLKAIGKSEAA